MDTVERRHNTTMNEIDPSQLVNRLGKYLYKHIDSAYKITYRPSTVDIYMYMYYQEHDVADSMQQINFIVNIATYAKKIRVNVIEDTEMENTIGHQVFWPDELKDLPEAQKKIYDMVCHAVEREYSDYDFIY